MAWMLAFAAACSPPEEDAIVLRVATLNIEYGGTLADFDDIVAAADALDADVIGVEEAWGRLPELAGALGWPYHDVATQVISRFPLLHPPGDDRTATLVEVAPGRVVAIGNVHLPSDPYGPYLALDGASAAEILALEEEVRVPMLLEALAPLTELVDQGIPAFLVGDFNAPSHLDWTEQAVGSEPQIAFPLAWPVSVVAEEAGFRDSWRDVYPDPVAVPGHTWPAARPFVEGTWNPAPDEPHDRIDRVLAAGASATLASERAGEAGIAEIGLDPYPTDHRAVVSTFVVWPAAPPSLVSVSPRVVSAGEPAEVRAFGPGTRIELRSDGAAVRSWPSSAVTVDTAGLAGRYELALVGDGDVAAAEVWVLGPGEGTALSVDGGAAVEPLTVRWTGSPGNRWDWVAVYRRDADPADGAYLTWAYTGASVTGEVMFDETSPGRWPLAAGEYTAWLLADDSYGALAEVPFEVGD